MSGVSLNFSVGYHNIKGLHHSVLGCKFHDHISLLNDVEIFSETWSECDACKNFLGTAEYKLVKDIPPVKEGAKGATAA